MIFRLFSPSMELVQLSARNEADTGEMLSLIEEKMSKGLQVQEKTSSLLCNLPGIEVSRSRSLSSRPPLQRPNYGVVVNGQTLANCLLAPNLPKFLKIIERLGCDV